MKLHSIKKGRLDLRLNIIKTFLFFVFLMQEVLGLPPQYERNANTTQSVRSIDSNYFYDYSFNGPRSGQYVWSWNWTEDKVESLTRRYGIPMGILERNSVSSDFSDSLRTFGFHLKNNLIAPDMVELTRKYRDSLYPIYQQWKARSQELALKERESVELLLNFLQDIPYGLPPENYQGRYIHGLFPPSAMFTEKFGDCDSKALAFVAILSWEPKYQSRLAFITVPGHMLVGIEDIVRPYDQYVEWQGKRYVFIEPVGVNHSLYGSGNQNYQTIVSVDPLGDIFSHSSDSGNVADAAPSLECPSESFPVDYTSAFSGERTVTCTKNVGGKYIKHGPQFLLNSSGGVASRKLFRDDVEI